MADWGDVGASFIGGFNVGSQFGNRRRALDLEEGKLKADEAYKGAQARNMDMEAKVKEFEVGRQQLAKDFMADPSPEGLANGLSKWNGDGYAWKVVPDDQGRVILQAQERVKNEDGTETLRPVDKTMGFKDQKAMLEFAQQAIAKPDAMFNYWAQNNLQDKRLTHETNMNAVRAQQALDLQGNSQEFQRSESQKNRDFQSTENALNRAATAANAGASATAGAIVRAAADGGDPKDIENAIGVLQRAGLLGGVKPQPAAQQPGADVSAPQGAAPAAGGGAPPLAKSHGGIPVGKIFVGPDGKKFKVGPNGEKIEVQ